MTDLTSFFVLAAAMFCNLALYLFLNMLLKCIFANVVAVYL